MDYGRLYEFLCGKDAVARLWGSPPRGDSFWKMLDCKGFNRRQSIERSPTSVTRRTMTRWRTYTDRLIVLAVILAAMAGR